MNDPAYLADVLAFAKHDNLIFPVRNKRPLVEWTKDATDDPGIIEAWWRQYGHPDFAWAIPKGIVIVDIDDRLAFDKAQLELPKTAMQGTPRGEHWVYALNGHPVEQRTKMAPGTDLRVGGKGYIVLYDPRRLLANKNPCPAWVETGPVDAAGSPITAPRTLDSGTWGTRDDLLLALGSMAATGKGFNVEVYRGMLETWRAKGQIVALDPARPWTDDDLGELAEQAEEWDRKAVTDREWGRRLMESLTRSRTEPQPDKWPAPPREEAYHGLAGEVIAAIADYTEADPVGLLAGLLTIYGAMIGDGGTIHTGQWQRPNLFTVQCGPSNDGRKGITYSNIAEIMDVIEPSWGKGLMVTGLGSGEGLIRHLLQQQTGDTPRALLYESEFSRLLNSMSWAGSTISPVLRSAWDGSDLGRAVSSSATIVPRHHVALLGNITETELRQLLTSTDQANGFANRFLWIATRRTKLIPNTQPLASLIESQRHLLMAALAFGRENRIFHWDDQAKARWDEFYAQKIGFGMWQAMTSRRQPMVVRIALIQAMLNRSTKGPLGLITLPILESAIALVEYSERTVVYLFGNSTGNKHSDALLDLLRREGEIKWMEARAELGIRGAADMNEVVEVLLREKMVSVSSIDRPGGGRPTRIIKLTQKP